MALGGISSRVRLVEKDLLWTFIWRTVYITNSSGILPSELMTLVFDVGINAVDRKGHSTFKSQLLLH